MDKSELIDKLNSSNSSNTIFVFIWALVIGFIGFRVGGIIFGITSIAIGVAIYGSVCFLSAKLHPDTSSIKLNCPLCKKVWSQREGLLVLADHQCPHCKKEIKLN